MIPYLIKSSLSLALLLGCYYLFFRKDKRFLFNRFYLLGSLIFSLIIPFITLPPLFQTAYFDDSHLRLSTEALGISSGSGQVATSSANHPGIRVVFLFYLVYGAGVLGMAFRYLNHVRSIRRLLATSEPCPGSGMPLRLVNQLLDPFSFGRHVVVNKDDYLRGKIHEDIIRHEYLHIRHRHTLDILFLELILVFYWFHPLVWAYRRALTANHEYCADDYVIRSTSSIASYSHTLLDFMHHRHHPHLGSGFHYSLTKHRILMMQRSASSAFAFANKLALTALAVVSLLATVSFTNLSSSSLSYAEDSVFTVVIDAGHGGRDAGATNEQRGYQEKDLVLAIAQAMAELVPDPSVRFIYTRQGDDLLPLRDRIAVAAQSHADLFLSLHINQHDDQTQQGMEVYYSAQNPQSSLSEKYSRQFARNITLAGQTNAVVKKADFLVLKETNCPAVLLNLGYLSNPQELAFLASKENQRQLASQITRTIAEIKK